MRSVVIVVLLAATARAQDKEQARALFREATQHFKLGEYQAALEGYKQAYRYYEDPSLLFNIGQCHRQLNQKLDAVKFFRTYLHDVPEAANREEVGRMVQSLELALKEDNAARSIAPQGPLAPTREVPPPPPPSAAANAPPPPPSAAANAPPAPAPPKPRRWMWGVVAAGAAAAVAVGVGVGVGVGARPSDPTPSLGGVRF